MVKKLKYVIFVAINMKDLPEKQIGFAQINVSLRGEERPGWMMKQECVLIAGKNLEQINTAKQNAAPGDVPVCFSQEGFTFAKVKAIRHVGKQDVYNMEVRGHHNFSVNGGLIVHNSIDATRYGLSEDMVHIAKRPVDKPPGW